MEITRLKVPITDTNPYTDKNEKKKKYSCMVERISYYEAGNIKMKIAYLKL